MTQDVATKKDVLKLQKTIQNLEYRMNTTIPEWAIQFEANIRSYVEKSAAETNSRIIETAAENRRLAAETRHHFDVVTENQLYDFRGTYKDKISQHEDRILVLEKHVGIKT